MIQSCVPYAVHAFQWDVFALECPIAIDTVAPTRYHVKAKLNSASEFMVGVYGHFIGGPDSRNIFLKNFGAAWGLGSYGFSGVIPDARAGRVSVTGWVGYRGVRMRGWVETAHGVSAGESRAVLSPGHHLGSVTRNLYLMSRWNQGLKR